MIPNARVGGEEPTLCLKFCCGQLVRKIRRVISFSKHGRHELAGKLQWSETNDLRFFTDFNGCFQHGLSFSFPQKNRMRVR